MSSSDQLGDKYTPDYGDLTELNTCRLILDTIGKVTLEEIARNYIDLLETSGAIYEANGDYALGIFSSGWCQYLDSASRQLCNTADNQEALKCGKWICHDCCWQEASLVSIKTGKPVDIECKGGLHLYAVPIIVDDNALGSLNVGYGPPPSDQKKLQEIANLFQVDIEILASLSQNYTARTPKIIEIAKAQLRNAAMLIGQILKSKQSAALIAKQQAILEGAERLSDLGAWEWDIEKDEWTVTNNWRRIHGSSFPTISFQQLLSFTHPDDAERVNREFSEALQGIKHYDINHRIVRMDNKEVRHVRSLGQVIHDETGKPMRMYGSTQDISEAVRIENSLRRRESQHKEAQAIAKLGHWHLDLVKNELKWSDEIFRIFELNQEKFGASYEAFLAAIHPDDRDMVDRAYSDSVKNKTEYNIVHRLLFEDGSIKYVNERCKTIYDDRDGTPLRSIGTVQDITRQIEIEEQYKDSQELFAQTLASISEAIFVVDPATRKIVACNPAVTDILGFTQEEVIGQKTRLMHVDAEHYKKFGEKLFAELSLRHHSCVDYHLKRKNGQVFPCEITSTEIVNHAGELAYIVSAIKDITDRKKQEEKLQKTAADLQERVKELNCLYSISKLVEKNDATLDEVLQGTADIIPLSWQYPEITCAKIKLDDQIYTSEKFLESEWLQAREIIVDGEKRGEVEVYILEEKPMGDEGPFLKEERSLLNAIAERLGRIIERKKTAELLQESENNFRLLAENLNAGLVIANREGYHVFANQMASQITGYEISELLKINVKDLVTAEASEKIKNRIQDIIEGRPFQKIHETFILKKDGSTVPVEVVSTRAEWQGDSVDVAIFNDITKRKQEEKEKEKIQAQLRQATKMQAIGTLAGGVAHEFNNLLAVILGSSELACDDLPADSYARAQLDRVFKASHKAQDLVRQILTFSRQKVIQKRPEPLNLAFSIRESMLLILASIPKSVDVNMNFHDDYPSILANSSEISQIMMNLCANAVWAMNEKGVISIDLEQIDIKQESEAKSLGLEIGRYLKLSVRDTGKGIDAETKERIFEPFYTTKEIGQGTGMGLATVIGIIGSYKGLITVDSKVGNGTTFHLYFPTIDEAPPQKELEHAPGTVQKCQIPTGKGKILFVDDETMFMETGRDILHSLGYEVAAETDSRIALKKFKSAPHNFDLVITDQVMPFLSGDDLIREILAIRADIPIILCTGFSSQIDEEKAKAMGVRKYMMKPLLTKDLARTVRKLLGDKRP